MTKTKADDRIAAAVTRLKSFGWTADMLDNALSGLHRDDCVERAEALVTSYQNVTGAWKRATQAVNRTTGIHKFFVVHTSKADGTDDKKELVSVIAANWSDAWNLIGDAAQRFMDDPQGNRMVHSISAAR